MSKSSKPDAAPAVSTEHDRLEPFAGTFRAEIKIYFGPGEPRTTAGTMVNSWDLGGRFLSQVFTGDPSEEAPPTRFEGRGYWGFNPARGQYEGFWIDNASTMMQIETGGVDETGKIWTMSGDLTHPETGERITRRSVITLEDPDKHRMEIFFTIGGNESKTMEILYRRQE